jgi:DNA polymerase epsilon subunit 2
VNHLHSIVGSTSQRLWVFGILTQKEDTHFYLEDHTFNIKLSFTELEYADTDSFFTENCVVMAQGYYGTN